MPQKIDALSKAIEAKDYTLMEKILSAWSNYKEALHTQKIISDYKINLQKESSQRENLLIKAVKLKDKEASRILVKYGADLKLEERFQQYDVTALDIALYQEDVEVIKTLLMNASRESIQGLDFGKITDLSQWRHRRQEGQASKEIRNKEHFENIKSLIDSFAALSRGITETSLIDSMNYFSMAFKIHAGFMLECLEKMIEETNCLALGLPLENTRLMLLDHSPNKQVLRILINTMACIFKSYGDVGHSHYLQNKFDAILIDLFSLYKNLKDRQDNISFGNIFKTDEEARAFILANIKDEGKRATIKIMNSSPTLNSKETMQTSSNQVTLFFEHKEFDIQVLIQKAKKIVNPGTISIIFTDEKLVTQFQNKLTEAKIYNPGMMGEPSNPKIRNEYIYEFILQLEEYNDIMGKGAFEALLENQNIASSKSEESKAEKKPEDDQNYEMMGPSAKRARQNI